MTTMWSTKAADASRWVTSITVRSRASCWIVPLMADSVSGSSDEVTSSSNRIAGSGRMARASDKRWRWPSEKNLPPSPTGDS